MLAVGLNSVIGTVLPSTGGWYLRSTVGPGAPDVAPFAYGGPGWTPLGGDWNGDGTASIAAFDPQSAAWYIKNSSAPGAPDVAPFQYGAPGWLPIAGDWDGNGTTTIGAFDPATATWYLKNSNQAGAPDLAFRFGAPGWLPIAGDWDGDGTTTIGVFDPTTATFYLRNSNSGGAPDAGQFAFGAPGWQPVAGDWNGDGRTTIGVVDPGFGTWYLKNVNRAGTPDLAPFNYGGPGWQPVVLSQTVLPPTATASVLFEANRGQTDSYARFLTHGNAGPAYFTPDGVFFSLAIPQTKPATDATSVSDDGLTSDIIVPQRLLFAGRSDAVQVEGEGLLSSKSNYFLGNDPTQWQTDVPNYAQVRYHNLYNGIDGVIRGNNGQLEYTYEVAPGASPSTITMALPDASGLGIDAGGQLIITTPAGLMTL